MKTEADGYYGEDGFVWRLYLTEKRTKASRIVAAVLKDLTDRRGLKNEFNACDCDIKKDIVDSWLRDVEAVLADEAA